MSSNNPTAGPIISNSNDQQEEVNDSDTNNSIQSNNSDNKGEELNKNVNYYYKLLIKKKLDISIYSEFFLGLFEPQYINTFRPDPIHPNQIPTITTDYTGALNGLTSDNEIFTINGWAKIGDVDFAKTQIAKVNFAQKFFTFGFPNSVKTSQTGDVLVRDFESLTTSAGKELAIKTLRTPRKSELSYEIRVPPLASYSKIGEAGIEFMVTAFHLPSTVYYGAIQTDRSTVNEILNRFGFTQNTFTSILQLLALWISHGSIDHRKNRVAITTSQSFEFLYILHLFSEVGWTYNEHFECRCYPSQPNLKYFYFKDSPFKDFIWNLFSSKYGGSGRKHKVDKYTEALDFLLQLSQWEIDNFLKGLSIGVIGSGRIFTSSAGLKDLYMKLLCLAGHGSSCVEYTKSRANTKYAINILYCKNVKSFSSAHSIKIESTAARTMNTKVISIDVGNAFLIVRGAFSNGSSGRSVLVPGEKHHSIHDNQM
ncbi:uncharacterized protein KGF55_003390 [Candida pseudojiufengensis]|uniref:uncharacterized protein n=1 Tax=Candida pseudojiufengensis TaxID=497109 RepID=UPI002224289C|nr:uncharacterized protein KGF55_003390 [Candida pseudojiufengensis]KAI5962314.1 hypothetical protein KGF55_003390 [Candida pseudojiufengensis]